MGTSPGVFLPPTKASSILTFYGVFYGTYYYVEHTRGLTGYVYITVSSFHLKLCFIPKFKTLIG